MKSLKFNLITLAVLGTMAFSVSAQYRSIDSVSSSPSVAEAKKLSLEEDAKLKKENKCLSNEKSGRVSFNFDPESNKIMNERTVYSCYFAYNSVYDPVTKTPVFVTQNFKDNKKVLADFATFRRVDHNHPNVIQPTIDYDDVVFEAMSLAAIEDMEYKFGNGSEKGQAIEESLYFTNTVPVVKGFKDGVWKDIEEAVRVWSKDRELSVVTGVIFDNLENPVVYGPSKVWVPTRLYKAVFEPKTGRSIAFVVPNIQIVGTSTSSLSEGDPKYWQTQSKYAHTCKGGCNPKNFITSVAQVEQVTGLKLFPAVNVGTTWNKVAPGYWPIKDSAGFLYK